MRRHARPAGPGLLSVLLGAIGAGPLLVYGLSATSDRIITDLGIDEAQFGLLATVCFACAALGNATLAPVADRHSDLSLMTAVFTMAIMALGLVAVPADYWLLLVAAGLSGLSQSFPNGVTNRILLERVPSRQRISWVGVKQSGVQVSQLVASVTFPLLALWVGWRGAALAAALIPLALMLMTWRALRTVPLLPEARIRTTRPSPQSQPNARSAARPTNNGLMVTLTVYGLLNGIGVQATNVYVPLFAVRELDFSLVVGGATAAVAGVVGIAARVGWARVMARGASGAWLLLALGVVALTGAAAFYGAWAFSSAALLWTAVCLHGASALGVSVVLMSSLMRTVPSASMASASGIVTAGMFTGFTIGPVAMGAIVGSPGGFQFGWVGVGGVYLLCIAMAVALISRSKGPE